MVLITYWEDDGEEKRKMRREEKLRAKKMGTEFVEATVESTTPAPSSEPNIPAEKILELLTQQTALSLDQSKKIEELSKVILEQKRVIQEIKEQGPPIKKDDVEVRTSPQPQKEKIIKLDDIDVNIIDTTGIETVGEAGGAVTKGTSIKSQLAKLKSLKKGD